MTRKNQNTQAKPAKPADQPTAPEQPEAAAPDAENTGSPAPEEAKPSKKKTLRVRHGMVMVGRGELRKTGDEIREGDLTKDERERFLADRTLDLI